MQRRGTLTLPNQLLATPKRKLTAALLASVVVYFGFPYVRCWSLASTASASSRGELGCGRGTIRLHTGKGVVNLQTGLDGYHVFGRDIYVSRLVSLLRDRTTANRRGFGPMAGNKDSLSYVVLDLLGSSGDPAAIDAAGALLTDSNDVVRGWAAIALDRLGDMRADLRPAIASYTFPPAAVASASSRGEDRRPWLDTPKDQWPPHQTP